MPEILSQQGRLHSVVGQATLLGKLKAQFRDLGLRGLGFRMCSVLFVLGCYLLSLVVYVFNTPARLIFP